MTDESKQFMPPSSLVSTRNVELKHNEDDNQKARPEVLPAPPMSIVVVHASEESVTPLFDDTFSRRVIPDASNYGAVSTFSNPFSTPFRLRPRKPIIQPSPLSSDGHSLRGAESSRRRKRSAHSMSMGAPASSPGFRSYLVSSTTPERVALPYPSASTDIMTNPPIVDHEFHSLHHTSSSKLTSPSHVSMMTTPSSPRPNSGALMNFQCLSLQSPNARRAPLGSFPRTILSSSTEQHEQILSPLSTRIGSVQDNRLDNTAFMRPLGLAESPTVSLRDTQKTKQVSSFNVYAPSPAGSIRSRSSEINSPGVNSAKSEPKIRRLTVLTNYGANGPEPRTPSNRPPLHGGAKSLLLSLDKLDRSPVDERISDRVLPSAQNAHAPKKSIDSMNSFQNEGSLEKYFRSPVTGMGPPSTANCRSSDSVSTLPYEASPHSSRHARPFELTSPSQRSVRSSPHTPLPRVTLTPRSVGSRSNTGLPRFPSPSGADMDVTSPFINTVDTSVRTSGEQNFHVIENEDRRGFRPAGQAAARASFHSLDVSMDGTAANNGSPHASLQRRRFDTKREPTSCNSGMQAIRKSDLAGGMFMGIKTRSLLTPSHSSGILQQILLEGDEQSRMSDMDDDPDAFFLTSPGVIQEERQAAQCGQPAAKKCRKRSKQGRNESRVGSSGMNESLPLCNEPRNMSSTSLAGMNHVASSTSLFGIGIDDPCESAACRDPFTLGSVGAGPSDSAFLSRYSASQRSQNLQEKPALRIRRSECSLLSIGLTLDENCNGGKGEDCGRDLITPPAVETNTLESPPPLLSSNPPATYVVASVATPCSYTGSAVSSVCISGANRQAVTAAIAKLTFQAGGHHSQIESPIRPEILHFA